MPRARGRRAAISAIAHLLVALLWVASPRWPLTNLPRRACSRRNAKSICNGHGVCGTTYVPHHCSPIVVWTHPNDRVALHTQVGYERIYLPMQGAGGRRHTAVRAPLALDVPADWLEGI
jgi:hypothetical protein